ncbi:MAG: hypothetical protein HXS47_02320 [Theionarchaea archaeon]|nr:hypothetical protein [Theionarchaea archaeon]
MVVINKKRIIDLLKHIEQENPDIETSTIITSRGTVIESESEFHVPVHPAPVTSSIALFLLGQHILSECNLGTAIEVRLCRGQRDVVISGLGDQGILLTIIRKGKDISS